MRHRRTAWASTTGGDCQTVPASDATSNAQIDLSFGNAQALALR